MKQLQSILFVLTLAVGACGVALADDHDGWRRDRDDRYAREGYRGGDYAYQQGLRQGQYDRSRNQRYNYRCAEYNRGDDNFRRSFRDGYDQGYNGGGYYSGPGYGRSYPEGQGGYSQYPGEYRRGGYGNDGYAQGLADGRAKGISDSSTGHSYRPTEHDDYKHADRGYNSREGSKDAYKQSYRDGFMAGYNQGYRRR